MGEKKLTEEEFTLQAIKSLRKRPYKGIHAVFSGFNVAFKDYFGKNARETVDRLIAEGKVQSRMVRGGPMLYLPGEMPTNESALSKILGSD